MTLNDMAAAVGRGFLAGLAGTAAMTVSSTVEMNLRSRKASDAPARAASKVLGVKPVGEAERQRFSNLVHWAYGTLWGSVRGLLAVLGFSGAPAAGAHLAAVWGFELVTLPALGVAPPVTQWDGVEVAIDAWHHLVYAAATSLAYTQFEREGIR
jgi:hypothetical protein